MKTLETDYLVIGTGAVSMTFVDVLLDESDATFIMIDRQHLPGGHWNNAYSFVRLHQPSSFYGVASTDLGSNRIDETGSNKGFYELASGAEISAYFEKLMRERFLPSGRVQYFPMCDYDGASTFHALLSGEQYSVTVNKKIVDGTFYNTTVPSTHTRSFTVADGVTCVPPNDLPRFAGNHQQFTILGGGKTAMDSCVWLLDNGANPDAITWLCPRDSWLMNRKSTQPGVAFFEKAAGGFAKNIEALRDATDADDLFERLESAETMLRIDKSVTPTMYHWATISTGEVAQLQRLNNIIRGKRVAAIEANRMVMTDQTEVAASAETLYIDCTARAVDFGTSFTQPIFEPNLITLLPVFVPLVTYSAAVVAYAEANFDSDKQKNELCKPIAVGDTPDGWIGSTLGNIANSFAWSQDKAMNKWVNSCRLNPSAASIREGAGSTDDQKAILRRIRNNTLPAVLNGYKLIAALDSAE